MSEFKDIENIWDAERFLKDLLEMFEGVINYPGSCEEKLSNLKRILEDIEMFRKSIWPSELESDEAVTNNIRMCLRKAENMATKATDKETGKIMRKLIGEALDGLCALDAAASNSSSSASMAETAEAAPVITTTIKYGDGVTGNTASVRGILGLATGNAEITFTNSNGDKLTLKVTLPGCRTVEDVKKALRVLLLEAERKEGRLPYGMKICIPKKDHHRFFRPATPVIQDGVQINEGYEVPTEAYYALVRRYMYLMISNLKRGHRLLNGSLLSPVTMTEEDVSAFMKDGWEYQPECRNWAFLLCEDWAIELF